MYRSNSPSSEWEWENNKQQERETTKKGEKERSLKTAAFGVLHATSINSHSTAVKSRFEVLPGEQCPSTSSRCILPYQAPSHLERSETSHPPSITSDVKFLARGRGWVKNQELHTSCYPLPTNMKGVNRDKKTEQYKIGTSLEDLYHKKLWIDILNRINSEINTLHINSITPTQFKWQNVNKGGQKIISVHP